MSTAIDEREGAFLADAGGSAMFSARTSFFIRVQD
jgi:hypothetical protein